MRWVISTAAFLAPMLLIIAIGGTCSTSQPQAALTIGQPALDELRTWVGDHQDILDHYAAKPGLAESTIIPHLALERFDRLGCDGQGNPWYRLAHHPPSVTCGVLRRSDPAATPTPQGAVSARLVSLSGGWWYWERPVSGP